jgi:hypothetical protein
VNGELDIFLYQVPEVLPDGEALPGGLLFYGVPFGIVKLEAAQAAGVFDRGAPSALAGASPGRFFAHGSSRLSRITTHTTSVAAERTILAIISFSALVNFILTPPKISVIFKGEGVTPLTRPCYILNRARMATASSPAWISKPIRFILSFLDHPFFFLPTHYHLLPMKYEYSIIPYSNIVKRFFKKNEKNSRILGSWETEGQEARPYDAFFSSICSLKPRLSRVLSTVSKR